MLYSFFRTRNAAVEVATALKGDIVIIAKTPEDAVIGYSTLHCKTVADYAHEGLEEYAKETLMFKFGAGTVDQRYQGKGIYKELNRRRLAEVVKEKSPLLITTTQNPRVEQGITAILNEYIQQGLLASSALERVLLPAFFDRRLTKDPMETKNTPFEKLNVDAGDGFSLLFKLIYNKK